MRHPQDDLLIVYALVQLAHDNKTTQREEEALNLAADIAHQHGLTVTDAIAQIELKP
ncbi:hypothetical protein C482_08843 [Natrialba chahannaoensis JCM 10990]|uniref:Uncharacterized protein n=1 Tax=Natrialba chahannaoensis JCM 10990 TaxID=1227492 RepID=M0ANI1_9EURY|nr:hypothetical protein [Natrialba chahannaoensis]ELZ00296.1 hypothetical protein C482_08843 [Natrialba chahannaoensis JCM 10990]